MKDAGPSPLLLVLELWREEDHLMVRMRSDDPPRDYGVVPLHELTLLVEAVAVDAGVWAPVPPAIGAAEHADGRPEHDVGRDGAPVS